MRSLLVALSLALAACGGGGDDDGGDGGDDDGQGSPDASDEDLGPCGGFAGLQCEDTAWCDFGEARNCGANDTGGVCRPRPESCGIAIEVCGCDGVTYQGECEANRAGTDVMHAGACS